MSSTGRFVQIGSSYNLYICYNNSNDLSCQIGTKFPVVSSVLHSMESPQPDM